VVFVDAISYGATGTIQKMELRRRFAGYYTSPESAASRGDVIQHTILRMSKMQLVTANHSDLDGVVDLVNQAYRGASSPGWTTEADLIEGPRVSRQALARMIENGSTTILLARDETSGQFLGCVAVRPTKNAEWYLSLLAVSPASQAAGLGKSIMAAAEKFVIEHGARSLKISVINVREMLIAWYERRGYERTGETEPFPYDDLSVGVPLRDDLVLVMLRKSLQGFTSC
jgi:ribosomal protein S18 acetylase RimI-like enzyme